MNYDWLEFSKKLQSIAQAGLAYSTNKYDIERYQQVRNLSLEIMSHFTQVKMDHLIDLFSNEKGYQTPKVDIRGVVFKENKILMVKEEIDGNWSLPGGWAEVGLSPGEMAVKEIKEESGYDTRPKRILAVLDKNKHSHPLSPYHTYKIFIECEIIGGQQKPGIETTAVGFFEQNNLPDLSVERNTREQIDIIFGFLANQKRQVLFD
ncbi:MAG: ADP-ribose pyrophosphatase [Caldithrix sp. RBG_13_44_9]|nr:MAG: ADP-ribose pyrophosphatase [Caldithrix sp. RBG_13_44_9]